MSVPSVDNGVWAGYTDWEEDMHLEEVRITEIRSLGYHVVVAHVDIPWDVFDVLLHLVHVTDTRGVSVSTVIVDGLDDGFSSIHSIIYTQQVPK